MKCVVSNVSVSRYRFSTYGRRTFAIYLAFAGPTVWNSLPDPEVSEDSYRQSLKTFLFAQY